MHRIDGTLGSDCFGGHGAVSYTHLDVYKRQVFDYSLGNPSVPCPPEFTAAMQDLLRMGSKFDNFTVK